MKKIKAIGIVLLIFSFFLFYFSSRFDYEYISTYNDVINLRSAGVQYPYVFGLATHYPIKPYKILMQPNDYLTISINAFPVNGTVYIVLWDENSQTVLKYSATVYASSAFLDFKTPEEILVEAYVASQNPNNTISATVTLHHYERPHWLFFSVATIVIILAIVLLTTPRIPHQLLRRHSP
jgi:hypothetical protein